MKKKSDQTLKEKLLECFPKTRLNSEGLPLICVHDIFGELFNCSRTECKECWNHPVTILKEMRG